MIALLFTLIALAATPAITSVGAPSNTDALGVTNTMMYSVSVTVGAAGISGTDHRGYLGVTSSVSAKNTCATSLAAPWVYTPYQTFAAGGGTKTFTVYNFHPGTTYYYKAIVGNSPSGGSGYQVSCGTLGTPALPAGLADLNLTVTNPSLATPQSKYVLLDTDDCSDTADTGANSHLEHPTLIAVDTVPGTGFGDIVWYFDIGAMTSDSESVTNKLTGWRYQKGSGSTTGHILGVVEHGYVYDWNFDGNVNYEIIPGHEDSIAPSSTDDNYCDGTTSGGIPDKGPCVSHDAVQSDGGNTYVITSYDENLAVGPTPTTPWYGICTGGETFVQDGFSVWTGSSWTSSGAYDVNLVDDDAADFDPTLTDAYWNDGVAPCDSNYWSGGPTMTGPMYDPVIDYTHANAISVYRPSSTDWVDLSLLDWSAIARFDGSTTPPTLKWILSGDSNYTGSTKTGHAPVIYNDGTHFTVAGGVTGTASFSGQHGAHIEGVDNLVLFDNGGARALKIGLTGSMNPGTKTTATINRSWLAVDPASTGSQLTCSDQGGAEGIGTSSILLDCNDAHVIEEFNNAAGVGTTGHNPDLAITLPGGTTQGAMDTGDDNACDNNSGVGDTYPNLMSNMHGWYRAYPLTTLGTF